MRGHLALTLKLLWRCRVSGADYPRCRAQIGFGGNGKTGDRKAASARAGAPRETKCKEFLNVGALPLRGVSGMSIADNFQVLCSFSCLRWPPLRLGAARSAGTPRSPHIAKKLLDIRGCEHRIITPLSPLWSSGGLKVRVALDPGAAPTFGKAAKKILCGHIFAAPRTAKLSASVCPRTLLCTSD
jgi:hypothetical protein